MADWDLSEIIDKARHVTGRYTNNEMSQTEFIRRINQYYQFTFPAEVKLERMLTYYNFNTVANQTSYTLPTTYVNYVPPGTIDRYELEWYQSPSDFYKYNPENVVRTTPWSAPSSANISGFSNANPGVISVSSTSGFSPGDSILVTQVTESGGGSSLNATYTIASVGSGSITTTTDTTSYAVYVGGGLVTKQVVSYSTTLTGLPIQAGSVLVDDGVETFTDNGSGIMVGSLGGTGSINYTTGLLAVTFNTSPTANASIQVSYINLRVGRPIAVLLYNNQLTFAPTPDTAYRFQVGAYTNVLVQKADGTSSATFQNATDRPFLDEWGPAIVYGTARQIHADYGELDAYQEVSALYQEQIMYIQRRTLENLMNTRSAPHF